LFVSGAGSPGTKTSTPCTTSHTTKKRENRNRFQPEPFTPWSGSAALQIDTFQYMIVYKDFFHANTRLFLIVM
jgi:hypothetical protein